MVQAKAKGTITLIEMEKNDHIWAMLKGTSYFSSLDIRAGYHHISIHPELRSIRKIPMETCQLQHCSCPEHILECYV